MPFAQNGVCSQHILNCTISKYQNTNEGQEPACFYSALVHPFTSIHFSSTGKCVLNQYVTNYRARNKTKRVQQETKTTQRVKHVWKKSPMEVHTGFNANLFLLLGRFNPPSPTSPLPPHPHPTPHLPKEKQPPPTAYNVNIATLISYCKNDNLRL